MPIGYAFIWIIAIVPTITAGLFAASYGGGSGTAEDPYQIWTAEQMNTLGIDSANWNKSFKLMTDIDMSLYSGTQYPIIGTSFEKPFTGIFDGNGHVLSNLTITVSYQYYVSLFGCLGSGGQIRNLGVENVSITGSHLVGGLVGRNSGTITSCYATGSVRGSSYWVGGLTGLNSGTITSCYAAGSVSGSEDAGNLVGENLGGTIVSSYTAGSVSGSGYIGGLVGRNSGTLTDCFWDIQTSGLPRGVGYPQPDPDGVKGKTTAEMRIQSTFTNAGWDFVGESANGTTDTWRTCADHVGYPRLSWEFSRIGDFDCPDGVEMEDLLYLVNRWMAATPDIGGTADGNLDGQVRFEDFAILGGNWISVSRQTGSLCVILRPQGAIDAGAKWRRAGTATWFASGETDSGIPIGSHSVEFKSITDWNTPTDQAATIKFNQTTDLSGYYTSVLPDGLIACWTMDDMADNPAVSDSSDNHLNGTAQRNTSTLTTAGVMGAALAFNGTSDYVDCGTHVSLFPDAWTVCAWVKCDDVATPTLLSFGGIRPCIKLQNNNAGRPAIIMGSGNYRTYDASAWATLKDQQWHHVAFTLPGSKQTSIESAQMYLDGMPVSVVASVVTGSQVAKSRLFLGSTDAAGSQRFQGAMDDVMLFSRVLPQDEIQRVMNRAP